MKEWFKYEFGYVNIDSENLFLTNSGNWSETKNLTEKTKKVSDKNDNKSSSIIGFIIIVFCVFSFMIYKSIISGKIGLTLIILTIGGGYKFYQYLKTEIGARFKIPLKKITEINILEKSVEIKFFDGEGLKANYLLNNIDEKGKSIMNTVNNIERIVE
jgi:hypothetical protein